MSDLGPEKFEKTGQQFFAEAARRAMGAKALAAELRRAGHQIGEPAVRTWLRGESEPRLKVTLWIAERYDISLDEHVLGQAFQERVSERLNRYDEQLRRLGRSMGWAKDMLDRIAERGGWDDLLEPEPPAVVVDDEGLAEEA